MKRDKSIPVLIAFRVGRIKRTTAGNFFTNVKAWCPYCEKWHYHGMSLFQELYTHRGPHCGRERKFPKGYYLKRSWRMSPKIQLEILEKEAKQNGTMS